MPIGTNGTPFANPGKYDDPRKPSSVLGKPESNFEGSYEVGKPTTGAETVPTPSLAFPKNIREGATNEPFIHINVMDPVAKNARTNFAVGLQMPTSIRVAYNANWQEIPLGAIGQAARLLTEGGADLIATGIGAAEQLAAKGAINLGQYTGTNIGAGIQIGKRIMVNPHAALQFEGMHFREFKLDFTFFPKSVADSVELDEIIFQLKYAMHPEGFGQENGAAALSQFWGYPQNFRLGFYAPNYKWLFRTSPCALLGCEVEYNGAGLPAFFKTTSDPVCIQMSLHFKELELLTKASIQEGR
jgi:hypothetical protein